MEPIPKPIMQYNLDIAVVSQYLAKLRTLDERLADAVKKIIDNTTVIHFDKFIVLLKNAVKKFKNSIKDKPFITVLSAKNKSDSWVVKLINEFEPDFIKDIKLLSEIDDTRPA